MDLNQSLITNTTQWFTFRFMSQANGSDLLVNSTYHTFGPITSLSYIILDTYKTTIDTYGVLKVISIFLNMFTLNDANAKCKIQISGDCGNTFIDITEDIEDGDLFKSGSGLWINSVEIGTDKLQIRVLGKSTDGNNTNILIDLSSHIDMVINKTLI